MFTPVCRSEGFLLGQLLGQTSKLVLGSDLNEPSNQQTDRPAGRKDQKKPVATRIVAIYISLFKKVALDAGFSFIVTTDVKKKWTLGLHHKLVLHW